MKEDLFCVHSVISEHHNKYAVVPPEHLCDGEKHCRNNEDEENCKGGGSHTLTFTFVLTFTFNFTFTLAFS